MKILRIVLWILLFLATICHYQLTSYDIFHQMHAKESLHKINKKCKTNDAWKSIITSKVNIWDYIKSLRAKLDTPFNQYTIIITIIVFLIIIGINMLACQRKIVFSRLTLTVTQIIAFSLIIYNVVQIYSRYANAMIIDEMTSNLFSKAIEITQKENNPTVFYIDNKDIVSFCENLYIDAGMHSSSISSFAIVLILALLFYTQRHPRKKVSSPAGENRCSGEEKKVP